MLIRKPFAAIAIDEENEVDDTTMNHEDQDNGDGGGARLVIDDDGDDDPLQQHHHVQKQKHAKKCHRRRRRSSARFLNLSYQPHDGDDDNDDDNDDAHDTEGGVGGGGSAGAEKEQLGELYKRAIRMNAENRINAGNSWNIKLIENMDKLTSHDNGETVNFTKASCTLDASVKIYSYRVDDVHLTSYKVLANLNRNDALPNNDKNKGTGNGNGTAPGTGQPNTTNKATNLTSLHHDPDGDDDVDDEQRAHDSSSSGRKANGTLETNLANINLNKLDAAYDIDPLFHKMSKTFDEGGAKGLLLVNLGVGKHGCNIVFDSKEDDDEDVDQGQDEPYHDQAGSGQEGMVDITSLTSKLDSLMGGKDTLDNLELVPQLRTLRQEYELLEKEGFITHSEKKSRRYATSKQEEKEAEMSIHQDYLERSRMSATTGRLSTADTTSDPIMSESDTATHTQDYAADDYGADDDDDDDHDDDADFGFDNFIHNDANAERYSSISFQNETFLEETQLSKTTSALLNALCSDMTQNDYQFFSQETLDKLGNSWAGAAHWKRSINLKKVTDKKNSNDNAAVTKSATKKTTKKKQAFVNFDVADVSSMTASAVAALLKPATATIKRGGSATNDPTQLSKAMITKYSKADNVLPLDAGMGIEQLSKLFLRPNAIVHTNNPKTVAFQDQVDNWGDHDDDDNDGPGFELHDDDDVNDDFVMATLDNVRKVEKIHVGYATSAKKVDVKRLKKDLWTELEIKMMHDDDDPDGNPNKDNPDQGQNVSVSSQQHHGPSVEKLSFKATVQEMEQQGQTQTDVTLPFYFICLLHLANEKGLELESHGLHDCFISHGSIV